jgi:hypothetical protein
MTGEFPDVIDHKDGNRLNNKWSNLRSVTLKENAQNVRPSKNSSSGVVGVSPYNGTKWRAWITVDYKHIHLGVYETLDLAISARKNAELSYFNLPESCILR